MKSNERLIFSWWILNILQFLNISLIEICLNISNADFYINSIDSCISDIILGIQFRLHLHLQQWRAKRFKLSAVYLFLSTVLLLKGDFQPASYWIKITFAFQSIIYYISMKYSINYIIQGVHEWICQLYMVINKK